MAYTKQTFVDNETVLSAVHMNHIEDGIAECVSCTEQNLTEAQKAQAKKNLGIGAGIVPVVTVADAGKFLRVSPDGTWVAEAIREAEGVSY